MRTFEGKTCAIYHNSDLGGPITISKLGEDENSIEVDGQDILDFVANYIRDEKISRLENMATEEILHL